jgi:hypothetical protein
VAAGVHHQPFFPFFIKFVVAHTFLLLFLVYGCDARTRRGHAAAPTTATAGQRGRGEGGWEERSCVVVLWLSQQPSHARKKRAESWRARKKKQGEKFRVTCTWQRMGDHQLKSTHRVRRKGPPLGLQQRKASRLDCAPDSCLETVLCINSGTYVWLWSGHGPGHREPTVVLSSSKREMMEKPSLPSAAPVF